MPAILQVDLKMGPPTGPPPPFNAKDGPRNPKDIMSELTLKHQGKVADSSGGRSLIFFHAAMDALNFAISMQTQLEERNRRAVGVGYVFMRIGIHSSGDDDDVFSNRTEFRLPPEDVALTAEIQDAAPEGRVYLSEAAYLKCQESWIYSFILLCKAQLSGQERPTLIYEAYSMIRLGRALSIRSAKATEARTIQCPNCKKKIPRGLEECPSCGVIFAKLFNRRTDP